MHLLKTLAAALTIALAATTSVASAQCLNVDQLVSLMEKDKAVVVSLLTGLGYKQTSMETKGRITDYAFLFADNVVNVHITEEGSNAGKSQRIISHAKTSKCSDEVFRRTYMLPDQFSSPYPQHGAGGEGFKIFHGSYVVKVLVDEEFAPLKYEIMVYCESGQCAP